MTIERKLAGILMEKFDNHSYKIYYENSTKRPWLNALRIGERYLCTFAVWIMLTLFMTNLVISLHNPVIFTFIIKFCTALMYYFYFISDSTFQRCIWRTRRSTQSWLRLETVTQMFRMLEEVVLHHHDHTLWNLYRCWMGMWICLHCFLSYMDHLSNDEGLWNQLWIMPENLCRHC